MFNVPMFIFPSVSHLLVGQPSLMIAIVVMVKVFSWITIISGKPCGEGLNHNLCTVNSGLHEDEMYPDIFEQTSLNIQENDIKKRRAHPPARKEEIKQVVDQISKNDTMPPREDVDDEVLREDHITQYLSEMMVNTDSEITSLQASEAEEGREYDSNRDVRDDGSMSPLTEHEEALLLLEEKYPNHIDILDNNDVLD